MTDLDLVINKIRKSCKEISNMLRDHIPNKANSTNQVNSSNDIVNKIDLLANKTIIQNLRNCSSIFCLGSEEERNLLTVNHNSGKYFVAFDPLDGSKNIDINLPTGTIFGVYSLENKGCIHLLTGEDMVYSCYCLYSSATILVETKKQTKMSILKNGNYHEIKSEMKMPVEGSTYSINEGNKKYWKQNTIDIVSKINKNGLSLRYDGCLVADLHRILLNGGIFMYPSDNKNLNGKLRLLYEVWPMAYIAKNMGAKCYGSSTSINLFQLGFPGDIHQKVQLIVCGQEENRKYISRSNL